MTIDQGEFPGINCEGGDGCDEKDDVRPYLVKFTDEDKEITIHYCNDCAHLVRVRWLPDVEYIRDSNL
jgi:hypothetical protein